MTNKISTGSYCIDSFLQGGLASDSITIVYGEPETGKSTLAVQCAVDCASKGLKTLFVDCDQTFSPKRLSQIAKDRFDKVAELIILIKPKDFTEQSVLINHLSDYTSKSFGLVVIDTFNSLYRAKISESTAKGSFTLNRELNKQMAELAQLARNQHLPIVVTSQVKSVFDDPFISVAPVATRVLQFWADTIIALNPAENPQTIKATVRRNRKPQEATCYLRIEQTGIQDVE